jgi:hypothetical protein
MKALGGYACIEPRFLDLDTSWCGQLQAQATLPPGERAPGTHWTGGWVGPRTGLDELEKIVNHTGTRNSNPFVIQPVGRRYTDWAIPVLGLVAQYSPPPTIYEMVTPKRWS